MDKHFKINWKPLEEIRRSEALPAVTVDPRVLAPERIDRRRSVLMDMHSLHVAIHNLRGKPVPITGTQTDQSDYTHVLANVVQSIVLYEFIVTDSILFETYPDLWEAYNLFPGIVQAVYIPEQIRVDIEGRVSLDDSKQPPPGITPEEWSFIVDQARAEKSLVDAIQDCRQRLVPPEYELDEDANRIARNEERPYLAACVRHSSLTLPRAHYYLELSREIGLPLAVDPARSKYFKVIVGGLEETFRRGLPERIIERFEELTLKPGVEFLKGIVSANLTLPALADYIFRFAKKKDCTLQDATLELRNSRHAQEFRRWCALFVSLADDGRAGLKEQSKMIAELQDVCEVWRKDINEAVDYKTRTLNLEKIPWHIGDLLKAANMQDLKIKDPLISPVKTNSYFLFLNDLLRPIS